MDIACFLPGSHVKTTWFTICLAASLNIEKNKTVGVMASCMLFSASLQCMSLNFAGGARTP